MATTMTQSVSSYFHTRLPSAAQHVEVRCTKPDEEAKIYTVNDLLVQRARLMPDVCLLAYPASTKGVDDYLHYTARDLDKFADEAAKKYMELGISPKVDDGQDEVIAILSPTSLDYVTSIFALSRLGYSLLLLSNRLPTEAYVSLLDKTKCHRIVSTPNFKAAIANIQKLRDLTSLPVLEKSTYDLPLSSTPYFTRDFQGPSESKAIAFIIHSSGSTGLPKPIFQTHSAALTNYSSGLHYKAFLTLPLYHNHGLSCFFRAMYAGNEIAMFNANLPMTGPSLIAAMEKLKPGGCHSVPYALKLLGESKRGIELLGACEIVMFGGSSCPDELGDRLVAAGVNLVSHYGATEIGQLMTSIRPPGDLAWNYLRPLEGRDKYMLFALRAPDTYELVILDGLKSKVVSNSDDPPKSFHTSDTFKPHPTIPNAWKYLGRLDDRITLVNGEKVLPIPFEHQVRANELVHECWMFGVGKDLPGIMVVPSKKAAALSKTDLFGKIWPSIEFANSKVEGFSQVSKEMVEILPIGTEYPSTDKGTMIRAKTYKKFDSEIQAVYERFENGPADDGVAKILLDIQGLEKYLLGSFENKIGVKGLTIETDLFEAGVDSLQAITVWGLIKRELDIGSGVVGQNVVFEHPSIKALAAHLYALRTGESVQTKDETEIMADLISKYSEFPQHKPGESIITKDCIILTGATGTLGAHVLSQLVASSDVETVYCLVRASSPSAATERVLSTLRAKLLPALDTLKVICLPSDLSLPNLGLDTDTISSLQRKLTKVIHCAWAVNFNLGVSSFESQHIRGAYNLMSLCLSTSTKKPASFFFCSSISAAAGTPLPATITETYISDLHHAQNMGYARSKLVTENIIKAASAKTTMYARVLRVGQIIGDSHTGLWNTTEAIPLMIQSAKTMGALPELDETPNWLPSDLVAKAILEVSGLNSSQTCASSLVIRADSSIVYHIQNSHDFHWTHDLLPALRSAGLTFRSVSQREWVRLLQASNPDPIANPTIKLVDFFTEKYDNDKEGRKGLVFLTDKTGIASPTVKAAYDVVGSGLVGKMVEKWMGQWI